MCSISSQYNRRYSKYACQTYKRTSRITVLPNRICAHWRRLWNNRWRWQFLLLGYHSSSHHFYIFNSSRYKRVLQDKIKGILQHHDDYHIYYMRLYTYNPNRQRSDLRNMSFTAHRTHITDTPLLRTHITDTLLLFSKLDYVMFD